MTRVLSLDIGFDRAHVLTVSTALRLTGYDSARVQSLSNAFEQRLAALPGVRSVSHGDIPLVGGRFKTVLTRTGANRQRHDARRLPSRCHAIVFRDTRNSDRPRTVVQ
jgi:hypothetical protein